MPVAEMVAVPKPPAVAAENQVGGGRARRAVSRDAGVTCPDIKATSCAGSKDNVHLGTLVALGGFL
jgi:hypothetical protein